jgi:enediyne biosynthesis protein E3
MSALRRRLLGISPRETSFERRGFRCDSPSLRGHLEQVGQCFVRGYMTALEVDQPEPLAARIGAEVPREQQGFAFEGAAMALTVLDTLTPWRSGRLQRLLASAAGDAHVYIIHVGAGWALARLPLPVERLLARLHPVFGWLALDGYGFHQGFFHWPRAVARQQVPQRLKGYARRVFDQGVGRSLWFVEGADPARIAADIAAFPQARQADLWSGVGLACAYAGGIERAGVASLRQAAGPAAAALAQGAAFAIKARLRAGIPTAGTALAASVLCGMTAERAAEVTDEALPAAASPLDLPSAAPPAAADGSATPLFELWRQSIQQRLVPGPG